MTINDINNLAEACTGCLACVDACLQRCISSFENTDGFKYTEIDSSKCIDCGRCYSVCPAANRADINSEQHLYAAFARDKAIRNRGSSGGIFEVIASSCLEKGYCVCGAAFNGTKLEHRIINSFDDLKSLLKSKYIQSDTEGVYSRVSDLLRQGEKVLFCGTPCQASALVNFVPKYCRDNLIILDFICHGVPSQKFFDMYIEELENRHKGTISDFSFRVKDNKYKHAHGFRYSVRINDQTKQVNGAYSMSSYYNAFCQYVFFRESCYTCRYATLKRQSDITLADFWGIEKYDSSYETDKGVSMIITNSKKGQELFHSIGDKIKCDEFPVDYGVSSNRCLTKPSEKPPQRDAIIDSLNRFGYEITAEKYFKCGLDKKLYWLIPSRFRTLIRRIRG